jgi:hypothetical protein
MRARSFARHALVITAAVAAASCGSGELSVGFPAAPSAGGGGGSIGTAATYLGAIADSLKHGALSVTVSGSQTVSGTITFIGGPTVPLTGTVDTTTEQMNATGGGYTLVGSTSLGTLSGSYTGPGGNGFLVASSDSLTSGTHSTYCGVYTSTNSNGWFAVDVLSSGDAGGFVVQTAGTAQSSFFSGTVISSISFTAVTNVGVALSGSLSSDLSTITGTYAPPVAGATSAGTATGQFSGTTGGC